MSQIPDHAMLQSNDAILAILKQVLAAISELHVARKNMLIYPASHEQVQRSLDRAHERLGLALKSMAPLVCSVSADGLRIGPHLLNTRLAAIKETVATFKRYGILTVSFSRLPAKDQLKRFLYLLTTDAAKMRSQGGIGSEITRQQIDGITVRTIDYSKLRVTQEREIQRITDHGARPQLWRRFVSQSLSSAGYGDRPIPAAFDASRMAMLLNSGKMAPQKVLSFFGEAVTELISHPDGADPHSKSIAGDLDSFVQLVRQLGPDLQQSFLSTAFDTFALHPPGEIMGRFIGALEPGQIYRTLQAAKKRGQQISPSLMAFLRKMRPFTGSQSTHSMPDEAALQALLEREAYEQYVDRDYNQLLQEVGADSAQSQGAALRQDPLAALRQELAASLEEPNVTVTVAQALMRLMAVSEQAEEYRDWARQLTFLLDELVAGQEFLTLGAAYSFLIDQRIRNQDPGRQKVIALVLQHFEEPQFIARAVQTTDRALKDTPQELLAFLTQLGEPVVAEILDRLSADGRLDSASTAFAILQRSAPLTVQEALERLADPRPAYVCFMLRVIRCIGSNQNIDSVKTLLDHNHPDVRMEALAALLSQNNAWGILRLRDSIKAPWSPDTQRAIELAGHYRIGELSALLLSMAVRRGRLSRDLERRTTALQALGRIGDPQVLPRLTKLAHRRGLMAGKHLRQLKQALFESLAGYPFDAARNLLHYGLKHKDAAIQSACQQIMRRQMADDRLEAAGPPVTEAD